MVYFDNAATTFPKPETVYTFSDIFYREYGVNVGRGQHSLADRASSLTIETRNLLLKLFHCPLRQVVFTPSATEALNVILQGLSWRDGSKVYITPFEHNAVLRVLHYLGLHCSPVAHKFLGTFPGGTVRFSVSYFNSSDDIKVLDEALTYIQESV